MTGPSPPPLPGRYLVLAIAAAAGRQAVRESLALRRLRTLRAAGFAAQPRDFRPSDPEIGRQILAGAFVLAGQTLAVGPGGDPWDHPSPSRRFAVALHRFNWLPSLMAAGEAGVVEALRLTLEWRRVFGRWNGFAWSSEVMERRVLNLACAARTISIRASDAEAALMAQDLLRQADQLLAGGGGRARAAERACVAAIAAAALEGPHAEALLARALDRLDGALAQALPGTGGHATRSFQAALELLFDLATLDEALVQRGRPPSDAVQRAVPRLAEAVAFATLSDGRLAAFQGGEACSAAYVAAARAADALGERVRPPAVGGYHRLESKRLQVIADGAAPAAGSWSIAACAQPVSLEVLASGKRLIVGSGWTPDAAGPQALRVVDAASTASLGDLSCGEPVQGMAARALGSRLMRADWTVESLRQDADGAVLLEARHDAWLRRFGFDHARSLYLDLAKDELRGEDRFTPVKPPSGPEGRRFTPFTVRFHLHPEVSALIARDRKSVLLKTEGDESGWWLRNDALEVVLEPSVHYQGGEARRTQQIVLRGQARADSGAKVRWKLSPAEASVDGKAAPA